MTEQPPLPSFPPEFKVELIDSEGTKSTTLSETLTKAIALTLAGGASLGILLLSFGWSFAWHWFGHWNVPFASLNIGSDLLLEYGRLVVVYYWWLALMWAFSILLSIWVLYRKAARPVAFACVLAAAFIGPWLASHTLGGMRARAEIMIQYADNFGGWPEVHAYLRSDHAAPIDDRILDTLSFGQNLCFRLLFRGPDGLWLIRMNGSGAPGATIFLPEEAIAYLRLRPPSGGDC